MRRIFGTACALVVAVILVNFGSEIFRDFRSAIFPPSYDSSFCITQCSGNGPWGMHGTVVSHDLQNHSMVIEVSHSIRNLRYHDNHNGSQVTVDYTPDMVTCYSDLPDPTLFDAPLPEGTKVGVFGTAGPIGGTIKTVRVECPGSPTPPSPAQGVYSPVNPGWGN